MTGQRATPRAGLVLGIETATAYGGVALAPYSGELLGEVTLRNRESHAERILPAVAFLLKTLGATLSDLRAVAVSCGPGSFTGLRAGIAAAKGLAFSLGVPLYGVPTLEALAAGAPPGEGTVCAVLNARRGEVFTALFRSDPDGLERLGPDRVVPAVALYGELPAGCLVIGEIPTALPDETAGRDAVRFAPSSVNIPRAGVVAALGTRALSESRDSELTTLKPLYLRPWDAETGRRGA